MAIREADRRILAVPDGDFHYEGLNKMQQTSPKFKGHILIVDDEDAVRGFLSTILETHGYYCHAACNAAKARTYLEQNRYDILLSDIQMPGESGLELIGFVRAAFPDTAVIVLTVEDNLQTVHKAIALDLYGYIIKPVDRSQILISVDNALRRRELELKEKAHHQMLEEQVRKRTLELQETVQALETARKEKEDAANSLRDQLFFLQILMDAIPAPIFYKDRHGKYRGGNIAFESYIGLPKDRIIGKTVFDIAPSELAQVYHQADMKLLQEPGRQLYETAVKYADGSLHDVVLHKAVYQDAEGHVAGIVGIMLDITDRKQLEKKLLQAQKLESIGRLAAGLAHEINTPAQYVSDNMRFLQEAFEDLRPVFEFIMRLPEVVDKGKPGAEIIAGIETLLKVADMGYLLAEIPLSIQQSLEGMDHVSKIVRSMRDFSQPGTDWKTETNLNKMIESAITVAQNEWKSVAMVETDFEAGLPPVYCLPAEINQVFLSLIINAVHALEEAGRKTNGVKGKIMVSTRKKGDSVEIRFGDTGCGIPEAIRHRIFDPFFTTKEVGRGIGQGLNIAYWIITEKHGGSVDFISEEGKGTTFTLTLPFRNTGDT